jgi:chorismate synthase
MKRIKFLTAGESHGKGLIGIIEGIPAGLEISEEYIKYQLSRRQAGHGRGGRMKIEQDFAEIWSGIRFGETLGSPVSLLINNKDSINWKKNMSIDETGVESSKVTLPRPGHADLAGVHKYGFDDIRNVLERASARETAMRVGLGSIARKLLEDIGIIVQSHVTQIHNVRLTENISDYHELSKIADKSPVRCIEKEIEKEMISIIDNAKLYGDSVGGIFEVIATGLPFGLGSYSQWENRLNSQISEALMSIPAIKGVEIGKGFKSSESFGSEFHDEIILDKNKITRKSNNAGGIEGGMSNTQPLICRAVMKPIPTLKKPLQSVDIVTNTPSHAHKERTDSCAVPAASIIAESMLCLVLADAILVKFGGDSMTQLKSHIKISGKY